MPTIELKFNKPLPDDHDDHDPMTKFMLVVKVGKEAVECPGRDPDEAVKTFINGLKDGSPDLAKVLAAEIGYKRTVHGWMKK